MAKPISTLLRVSLLLALLIGVTFQARAEVGSTYTVDSTGDTSEFSRCIVAVRVLIPVVYR